MIKRTAGFFTDFVGKTTFFLFFSTLLGAKPPLIWILISIVLTHIGWDLAVRFACVLADGIEATDNDSSSGGKGK